jgi:hypothetical protein
LSVTIPHPFRNRTPPLQTKTTHLVLPKADPTPPARAPTPTPKKTTPTSFSPKPMTGTSLAPVCSAMRAKPLRFLRTFGRRFLGRESPTREVGNGGWACAGRVRSHRVCEDEPVPPPPAPKPPAPKPPAPEKEPTRSSVPGWQCRLSCAPPTASMIAAPPPRPRTRKHASWDASTTPTARRNSRISGSLKLSSRVMGWTSMPLGVGGWCG